MPGQIVGNVVDPDDERDNPPQRAGLHIMLTRQSDGYIVTDTYEPASPSMGRDPDVLLLWITTELRMRDAAPGRYRVELPNDGRNWPWIDDVVVSEVPLGPDGVFVAWAREAVAMGYIPPVGGVRAPRFPPPPPFTYRRDDGGPTLADALRELFDVLELSDAHDGPVDDVALVQLASRALAERRTTQDSATEDSATEDSAAEEDATGEAVDVVAGGLADMLAELRGLRSDARQQHSELVEHLTWCVEQAVVPGVEAALDAAVSHLADQGDLAAREVVAAIAETMPRHARIEYQARETRRIAADAAARRPDTATD